VLTLLAFSALLQQDPNADISKPDSLERKALIQEKHFGKLCQLTFGGQNAEGYLNKDCTKITYQAQAPGYVDEQIFSMNIDGSNKHLVSTGLGRCTCSYYSPDGKWIYYSSTHATQSGKQPDVDMSKGYVWMVNSNFAMYRTPADAIGNKNPEPVIREKGYIAETTIDPNGTYMVWTGSHEGDLEIYRSDLNGKHRKRLTKEVGYDGGPFVSWDGKKVVYRRDVKGDAKWEKDYKDLLAQDLIRPTKLEIWIMNPDGSGKRQITHLNCASFAPFLAPDNKHILFSSNYGDPKGREFDIFSINVNGDPKTLERITHSPGFDGFPMFTRDGKKLVFASNRFGTQPHETNLFIVDWKN
jgi:Tol biopolymer transport system component